MRELIRLKIKPDWKPQAKEKPEKDGHEESKPGAVVKDHKGYDVSEIRAIGLEAVAEALGVEPKGGDGYDFTIRDLRVAVVSQSSTREVTLEHTGWLTPEQYNPKQNCDVYIFVRVNPQKGDAVIGGWIPRDDFYRAARFRSAGDRIGCITAAADGHRVRYRILRDLGELRDGKP